MKEIEFYDLQADKGGPPPETSAWLEVVAPPPACWRFRPNARVGAGSNPPLGQHMDRDGDPGFIGPSVV